METRKLGRTDLDVSVICLGTMTWGEQNTEAQGHEQMDYAVDRGVTFFDAAEMYPVPPRADTYGRTEEIIGAWFAARGSRDKVVLASKVAGRSAFSWLREGGGETRLTREQIHAAADASLKRLRTDYIDLYQLHWPDRPMRLFEGLDYEHQTGDQIAFEETLGALDELVMQGKVRHVGLSNESPWGTMNYLERSERLDLPRVQSIQNCYNLLNRTYETGLSEIAYREGVGLLAYSPLGQGCLSGKYLDGARPEGSRRQLFDRMQRYETPAAEIAIGEYVELAREHGLDPTQMALQFVTSRPFVTSNIIGATTMAQLETNIASAGATLSDEVLKGIEQIHLMHSNPCP